MNQAHIFTASCQPATAFVDACGESEILMGYEPDEMLRVGCCGKNRPAKDVVVQCFYDGFNFWCADGNGCKSAEEIKAKRDKEFANRSLAQRARRERERGIW